MARDTRHWKGLFKHAFGNKFVYHRAGNDTQTVLTHPVLLEFKSEVNSLSTLVISLSNIALSAVRKYASSFSSSGSVALLMF